MKPHATNSPLLNPDSACPICGQANNCQMTSLEPYKGLCWCQDVVIPPGLLALVPEEFQRRSCICRSCVEAYDHRNCEPAEELQREL